MPNRKKESRFSFHTSRFKFIWYYIIALLILAAGIVLYNTAFDPLRTGVVFLVAIAGLAILEMRIRRERITLRDEDITIEVGFLSKNTTRVRYHNITDFNVKQSLMQRMLRYGDIEIGVPGSSIQQTQYFSGKGNVKMEPHSGHRGIRLKKFQKVRKIEALILSKMKEQPYHSR